jgi:hypothetical protein
MPTTTGFATDLITFSRGSLATVTDSNGYIKWAPHNLLLASEQFDTSSWTRGNIASITANAVAAPNGTTTADLIVPNTTNGSHRVYTTNFTATVHTFGCFVKANGYTKVGLRESATSGAGAAFSLSGSGSVLATYDASGGTVSAATITSLANGWYLIYCTITFSSPTATAFGLNFLSPSYTSGDLEASWTPNGTDGIYAWGAHLYRSDLGGMQANASAYPMYNPSTRRNLLGFTELLTTGWTNTNTTDSQVAIAAPNGSANSIDVAATAGNGTLLASLSLLASPYTFSIWLRRKTGTGTIQITVDGTTYVTATVTADWQRFSTTLTPSAGTRTPGIRIVTSGDAVYAWGAQLSDSASLDTYVPNFGAAPSAAAAHGPRLDYDPSTLAAKGLLVEEQRTNLLLRSAEFDVTATWTNLSAGTGTNSVRTANAGVAPDGSSTADRLQLTLNGGTTASDAVRIRQAATTTAAAHTLSVWLKSYDGVSTYTMALQLGSVSQSVTVTGQWQRFSLTTTTSAAVNANDIFIRGGQTPTHSDSVDVLAWGAQLEAGSFATSYIPTAAASVTRNADVASVGVSQFPYSATEGTLFISATTISTAVNFNRYLGLYVASSPAGNRLVDLSKLNSQYANYKSSDTQTTSFGTWQQTGKICAAYKVDDYAFVANGGTVVTDTATSGLATADTMFIGHYSNTNQLNGHIRQITYIPRRLGNSELQQRTA